MRKPGTSEFFRRSVLIGAGVLCFAGLGWRPAGAAVLDSDIAEDSEIQLLEKNQLGSYRRYSVHMSTQNGTTTLSTDKDGVATAQRIPEAECIAMWRNVITAGIEDMTDPPAGPAFPDQSEFTVTFRVKDTRRTFTVYSVDSLPDTRYRDVVREILTMGDLHASGACHHE
jgi:hypothetical protein